VPEKKTVPGTMVGGGGGGGAPVDIC